MDEELLMPDYGKLYGRIWSDRDFVQLEAQPQQVYCMLVSYPGRNYAGVLSITVNRWSKSTKGATKRSIMAALNLLHDTRFLVVDWDTEEVLVRTFIKNDEVYKQPNLMKAALKQAAEVQSEAIRWELHEQLMKLPAHKDDSYTKDVANALVRGLQPPLAKPLPEPFGDAIPNDPGVGVGAGDVEKTFTDTYTDTDTYRALALRDELVPAKAATRSKVLEHKMPEDWIPSPEILEKIGEAYPTVDLERAAISCRDWFLDKPQTRRAGWDRTFQRWVKNGFEQGHIELLGGATRSAGRSRGEQKVADWANLGGE